MKAEQDLQKVRLQSERERGGLPDSAYSGGY